LILAFILIFPVSLSALIMASFDEPYVIGGLSDNAITDIVEHNGAVWMSTGLGLSFSYFDDLFWYQYDSTNGLTSDAVSAMYSAGGRLWVAGNYFIDGDDSTYADGLYYTDDDGMTWNNITPDNTYGGLRVIYDIVGIDDYIFCSSWIGGLIGSFDGGQNWKNIYFTPDDSIYVHDPDYSYPSSNLPPLYSNMYFSTAVDTTHPDSLVLWAGSVAGIRRFVYSPAYAKPNSEYIVDYIAADSFVFVCGDGGLTRIDFTPGDAEATIVGFRSSFETDGLPGPVVTTAYSYGGRLFVGTADSVNGSGTGVAVSDDDGLTFGTGMNGLDDFTGPGKYPVEFAPVGDHLFMAGLEAGLYMTSDTGQNWQKVNLDAADITPANGRNIIHSVVADSNNLWVGTDSGLVLAYVSDLGGIDSTSFILFEDGVNSGGRSFQVGVQNIGDTTGNIDSTIIWSINHAIDTMVGENAVFYSSDYGQTWETETNYLVGTKYFDIDFINQIIYLVGANTFTQSFERLYWYPTPGSLVRDSADIGINFTGLNLTSIDIRDDTIYVASEDGFAISPPSASASFIWHIYRANNDPTVFDRRSDYRFPNLSGNFVNVLDVQPLEGGQGRIWASTRPSGDGQTFAVSTSTLDGLDWQIMLEGNEVWNFDFNGPEVFAASTNGLLYSSDTGHTWQTITIEGVKVTTDDVSDFSLDSNTFITAVTIVGDSLWVGTLEEGSARIALEDFGTDNWEIYRVYDSTFDVYAYPVPFSTNGNQYVYFHYPVNSEGYVTIEVYDFKMDKIATVVENEFREQGISDSDRWDGRMESGAPLAVGIYYFKVVISTGETFWGKLAIIP